MAYANGFQGDQVSLQHILKTLDAKTYDIPGVITNPNLSVTAGGESVYFYTRSAATAAAGSAGASITYTVKGAKRIDVPMLLRMGFGAIVPYVNHASISADVVGDKVVQETISQANLYNEALVTALASAATAKTYTKDVDAFAALTEAVANFRKDNKVSGALNPTGILCSPTFFASLLNVSSKVSLALVFREGETVDNKVRQLRLPGIPCPVIECPDLTSIAFIIVNAEGVAAPIVARSLAVVDATPVGYPGGTLIAGELPYGFKIVTSSDDLTLDSTTGYLVAKYTMATA